MRFKFEFVMLLPERHGGTIFFPLVLTCLHWRFFRKRIDCADGVAQSYLHLTETVSSLTCGTFTLRSASGASCGYEGGGNAAPESQGGSHGPPSLLKLVIKFSMAAIRGWPRYFMFLVPPPLWPSWIRCWVQHLPTSWSNSMRSLSAP